MWIRLPLSCLQRKSNRPVRFIILSANSAAESTGDMAIYCESPLTPPLSAATTGALRRGCAFDETILRSLTEVRVSPYSLPTHVVDANNELCHWPFRC